MTTWAATERSPRARAVVRQTWSRLLELDAVGCDARLLAALRYVLLAHRPTPHGRCQVCARRWCRRRRWPCATWRQVFHELVGRG